MRHKLLCSLFLLFFLSQAIAQIQKALIIGIDIYKPENAVTAASAGRASWMNLDGCVNDATAVRDLVVAKYGFLNANTTTLFNEQATRARIISELKKLASEAKKGDVIFVYYAGHGSQVYNSLSPESDKKDESIVPSDSYKGAADIRDKELAALFNQILDKGALLTVIFDSCHSGSIGRGFLNEPPKMRFIEESRTDAKDSYVPVRPETRNALILSAAQDFEFAKEQRDENNIPHGAFTIALLRALQQLSPDASVSNIYTSITSIMKYYGKTQEPVLAANDLRKAGTLFGLPKGTLKNKLTIGVSKIDAKGVELQGGYTCGLSEGVKLAGISTKDTLMVKEMRGANKSFATVLNGDPKKIAPGSLFEVISWSSGKAPALKVYIPQTSLTEKEISSYSKVYQSFRQNSKVKWTIDIAHASPEKIYYFDKDQWVFSDAHTAKSPLGTSLTISALAASLGKASSVFVNFPPTMQLREQFLKEFGDFSNISIVADPNESQYSLIGRLNTKNQLEYALVKSQVTVQDTTESLPQRTDFISYDGTVANAQEVARQLSEYAFRIAKIRDWLMLQSPAGGARKFPFKINFQYYTSGQPLVTDKVNVNDTLSIYFKADESNGEWDGRKRYIYVFSIDSKGAMSLLFPSPESGNVENRYPVTNSEGHPAATTHIADILITPPAGADNYFMLSSEEAISNLSAFEQEGVLKEGARGAKNALEDLLFTGTKTRNVVITPVNWSIFKAVLRTYEKDQN
jgi:hypothetical protein